LNKNIVAFSDLEQYSCFASVSIQSFKNQIAIECTTLCTAPMLSKSKKFWWAK